MASKNSKSSKSKKKAPSPRRDGREAVVQYLYANDVQGEIDFSPEKIAEFWKIRLAREFAREFAAELIRGIRDHQTEIDEIIREHLKSYAFHRLTAVDRSILRLGTYEIVFVDDTPHQVALNEAIEVSKRFGSEESPKFINGILDAVSKSQEKD